MGPLGGVASSSSPEHYRSASANLKVRVTATQPSAHEDLHGNGTLEAEARAVSSRQVILRHAVTKRIAGHLQEAAGFRDIAGRLSKRFFEHPFFHVLKRQAEG